MEKPDADIANVDVEACEVHVVCKQSHNLALPPRLVGPLPTSGE